MVLWFRFLLLSSSFKLGFRDLLKENEIDNSRKNDFIDTGEKPGVGNATFLCFTLPKSFGDHFGRDAFGGVCLISLWGSIVEVRPFFKAIRSSGHARAETEICLLKGGGSSFFSLQPCKILFF